MYEKGIELLKAVEPIFTGLAVFFLKTISNRLKSIDNRLNEHEVELVRQKTLIEERTR